MIKVYLVCHHFKEGDVFTIRLNVAPIDDLKLHEEIIEPALVKLTEALKESTFLWHPIITDDKHMVVLDGMHRVCALQRLNYKYIVTAQIDYFHPSVKVCNWYRVFCIESDTTKLRDMVSRWLRGEGYEYSLTSLEDLRRGLGKGELSIGLVFKDLTVLGIASGKDIVEKYRIVARIDELFKRIGAEVSYCAEDEALRLIREGKATVIEATPPVSKQDVIQTALAGRLFPPKTTRHIIPVRPLFINFPLKFLRGGSLTLANKLLSKMLSSKLLLKVRGRISVDRLYEEDFLYIFI